MILESAGIRLCRASRQHRAHARHHLRRRTARRAAARGAAPRLQSRPPSPSSIPSRRCGGSTSPASRSTTPTSCRCSSSGIKVKEILVALPDERRRERRRILKELQDQPVEVKVLPAVEDITSGRVSVTDLRPLEVNDLLGRDKVPPNVDLLARKTRGQVDPVTGAGGSIGSELVRQLLKQGPRRIVLFDISEAALYEIEDEIAEFDQDDARRSARPGDRRRARLGARRRAGARNDRRQRRRGDLSRGRLQARADRRAEPHLRAVGTIPSAPRCWPIAPRPPASSSSCSSPPTRRCARPTSWAPASVSPSWCCRRRPRTAAPTIFTMVRFGNVLDSSGSVVKKFRRQIRAGGPVTVTHPEIIRYFMSIPEAAELVIQAGAMAEGGDVFVLDMGEPVRIDDLARLMVRLSGLRCAGPREPRWRYRHRLHGPALGREALRGAADRRQHQGDRAPAHLALGRAVPAVRRARARARDARRRR